MSTTAPSSPEVRDPGTLPPGPPAPRGLGAAARRHLAPHQITLAFASLALLVLVVFPLVFIILPSMTEEGRVTLEHFRTTLTTPRYYDALLNTLYLGVGVAVLSIVFGVPMAWGVSRTNMPAKGLVRALSAISYITPALLTSFAYVVLLAPNSGAANTIIMAAGFDSGPFNAFSIWTMIFVIGLNTFPFVFFLTSAALESVDVSLEESAQILGASRRRHALRITLPLVMPAILTGALLAFVFAISLFGSQAVLGLPARVFTLPTRIYSLFVFPPRYGLASALAIQLLLLTVAGLYAQHRFLRKRSYVTLGGKGSRTEVQDLGRWRYAPLAYCGVVFSFSLVVPVVFLLLASFTRVWALGLNPGNVTLANYQFIFFDYGITWRALRNSLVMGAVAATLAMGLGALVAYIDVRRQSYKSRILDYLSILPYGLPGIVLAVGLVQAWLWFPVSIYGTMTILVLAYLTRSLPVSVRTANISLRQVDPSLEDASRIVGASWLRSFTHITAPLIRRGLLAGWVLMFVHILTEVSASILLFTNRTITLGVANFNLYDNAELERVAALAILTLTITMLVVVLAWALAGVRIQAQLSRSNR